MLTTLNFLTETYFTIDKSKPMAPVIFVPFLYGLISVWISLSALQKKGKMKNWNALFVDAMWDSLNKF